MGLLDPTLPDYDPLEWRRMGFADRVRLVCRSWALQGYGSPWPIYLVYALKVALFAGAWVLFCSLSPSLGGVADLGDWWLEPLAFQKAIVWSALFEVLGLGCGSGPLTGRYAPPIGGALYWLRPGTTKLGWGGRRTWVDVALYAGLIAALLYALCSPAPGRAEMTAVVAVAALATLSDRTLFLAARGEHYLITIAVFALAASEQQWIAGAMGVQAALWWFAGVSKLNHHFPPVVCVMVSNSPVLRFGFIRERMYRDFPDDLRHPPRHYLARDGVDLSKLERTDKVTFCPFKGLATYYAIKTDGGEIRDAVWSYEEPYLEAELLRDRLAFDASKVDLEL